VEALHLTDKVKWPGLKAEDGEAREVGAVALLKMQSNNFVSHLDTLVNCYVCETYKSHAEDAVSRCVHRTIFQCVGADRRRHQCPRTALATAERLLIAR
jgi:hypothetical protein